jgi:hypothetical protein
MGTETCSLPFIKYKYDVPDVNCFIILVIKLILREMVGLLVNNDLQCVCNHRRSFGGAKGRDKYPYNIFFT